MSSLEANKDLLEQDVVDILASPKLEHPPHGSGVNGAASAAMQAAELKHEPVLPDSLDEEAAGTKSAADEVDSSLTASTKPVADKQEAAASQAPTVKAAQAAATAAPAPAAAAAAPAAEKKALATTSEQEEAPSETLVGAAKPAASAEPSKELPDLPASTPKHQGSKEPVAAAAAADAADMEVVRASDPLQEVREPAISVAELSKQLAATSTSPGGQGSSGGAAAPGTPAPAGGRVSPSMNAHDVKNTANASVLLAAGEFRLQPGRDTVEYDALMTMRLEDGIDVTRKEEYLAAAPFKEVFGMSKEEFAKLPAWKRLDLKKKVSLF